MCMTDAEEPEEAISKDGIRGTAVPSASRAATASRPRDAFSELMKPKPKPQPAAAAAAAAAAAPPAQRRPGFRDRDGLGLYLADPARAPRVIFHSDDFVAVHDLYPKATVHALLLPRDPARARRHPLDALSDDPAFLAAVRAEAAALRRLAAKELQRLLGRFSARDAAREAVLDGRAEPGPGGALPAGRDWEAEVVAGVHAHPSMNHLHVHVLSRDMHSPCLRHRKHYNSFNTPFLVPLEAFPLAPGDPRRRAEYLASDLVCWRCGKGFKNRFKELKEHLEREFDEWKRE